MKHNAFVQADACWMRGLTDERYVQEMQLGKRFQFWIRSADMPAIPKLLKPISYLATKRWTFNHLDPLANFLGSLLDISADPKIASVEDTLLVLEYPYFTDLFKVFIYSSVLLDSDASNCLWLILWLYKHAKRLLYSWTDIKLGNDDFDYERKLVFNAGHSYQLHWIFASCSRKFKFPVDQSSSKTL